MLKTLTALVPNDKDLPLRAYAMQWREEFRTSAIYDRIPHSFYEERGVNGEYIPLNKRRPCVMFGLPQIIVNDSTAMLFSEAHFPAVEARSGVKRLIDQDINDALTELIKETVLREIMLDAAVHGSSGSVCVWLRVLKSRVFFKVLPTAFLTPAWDDEAPDTLSSVSEQYKVKGSDLKKQGYTIADAYIGEMFWFQRVWTTTQEIWMLPWIVTSSTKSNAPNLPVIDTSKTKRHDLGFVPMVWIKNLPGGDDIDGAATVVNAALSNSIELDYQLSQGGRGLRYSSDPTMHIQEEADYSSAVGGGSIDPVTGGKVIVKGAANAIRTGANIKMLEISGAGSAAVLEYARFIREISLEQCGGNRASAEKLSGAQSGRAMEMMNQGLIFLADKLRTSYGENGLLKLLQMVLNANAKLALVIGDKTYKINQLVNDDIQLSLKWPPWYAPTATDHQAIAVALKTYRDAGVISQETGIAFVQHDFDIEDPAQELARIKAEQDALDATEVAKAQAMAPKESDTASTSAG